MIDFKREEITRKNKPLWEVVLIVLAGIVAINYLITLCNRLGEKYAGIASIAVLVSSVVICGILITKLVSSYVYALIQSSLVFERKIGNKSDILLKIKFSKIDFVKPYEQVKDKKGKVEYNFTCRGNTNKIYYGEFENDGRMSGFIFQPSNAFLEAVIKKMSCEKEKCNTIKASDN